MRVIIVGEPEPELTRFDNKSLVSWFKKLRHKCVIATSVDSALEQRTSADLLFVWSGSDSYEQLSKAKNLPKFIFFRQTGKHSMPDASYSVLNGMQDPGLVVKSIVALAPTILRH